MAPVQRLNQLLNQLSTARSSAVEKRPLSNHSERVEPLPNDHELNPAFFLPRAALLEPNAKALVHRSITGKSYSRTYFQLAERVKGLAYYFKHHGYKRIAILGPNTPAHLETLFAASAAGAIVMGVNYRLTKGEIEYVLNLGSADLVIVDQEFKQLADPIEGQRRIVVDKDVADSEVDKLGCEYGKIVKEGMAFTELIYTDGWDGLDAENVDENATIGLFFTSGTTGNPKVS